MVLTSQAHRRCTPRKNRRIPTISAGCFGGWLVDVSAVDTGLCGSESAGFLVVEPGAAAVWNHRHSCLRPCVVCRAQPPPPGGPSPFVGRAADRPRPSPGHLGPITRHQRHDLKHRALSGARAKARRPWFDADPARTEPAPPRSCPESARVGLLHEGRDLLATGCAYCTRAPPTRSTPNPPPVAPHPRAVHPDDTGSHHSHRAGPLRQAQAATLPSGRPTQAVS